MQIKLATARGLGYTGDAEGLRDPNTNLTYGVKYLAGAYRVANGDHDRAVHYYAAGYYYAAKRQRLERAVDAHAQLAEAVDDRVPGAVQRACALRRTGTDGTTWTPDAAIRCSSRPDALTRQPHRPTLEPFRGELRRGAEIPQA